MSHNTKRKLAGYTLIELMIAMSVTMVLLYAALHAFKDASQSSKQISLASDMTDNLRAGLNLIQQDLTAGRYGDSAHRYSDSQYPQRCGDLQRGPGPESAFFKRWYLVPAMQFRPSLH